MRGLLALCIIVSLILDVIESTIPFCLVYQDDDMSASGNCLVCQKGYYPSLDKVTSTRIICGSTKYCKKSSIVDQSCENTLDQIGNNYQILVEPPTLKQHCITYTQKPYCDAQAKYLINSQQFIYYDTTTNFESIIDYNTKCNPKVIGDIICSSCDSGLYGQYCLTSDQCYRYTPTDCNLDSNPPIPSPSCGTTVFDNSSVPCTLRVPSITNCLVYDNNNPGKCLTCEPLYKLSANGGQCTKMNCLQYDSTTNKFLYDCKEDDLYLKLKCTDPNKAYYPSELVNIDQRCKLKTDVKNYYVETFNYNSANQNIQVFLKCSYKCQECTSFDKCLKCESGFYILFLTLNGPIYPNFNRDLSYCTSTCPEGYYKGYENSLFQCIKCGQLTPNCLTCDQTSTTCQFCQPTYLLQLDNSCKQGCQKGFYADFMTGKCIACVPQCKECYSNSVCTTCQANYFLFQDELNLNLVYCISEAVCAAKAGFWAFKNSANPLQGSLCKRCSSNCYTCQANSLGQQQECTLCYQGFFLTTSKECKTDCDVGQYKDYTSNKCQPCSNFSCENCYNSFQNGSTLVVKCTSCNQLTSLKYLTQDFKCVSISGCGDGYYADISSKTCKACNYICSTCNSSNDCTKCKQGYYYKLDNLSNGQCVTCYESGYYRDSNGGNPQCSVCPAGCDQCESATKCTICKANYVLDIDNQCKYCTDDNSCQTICTTSNQLNFYFKQKRACAPCPSNCLSCNYHGCLSCYINYYLLNYNCYDKCPVKYYNDINTKKCELCTNIDGNCISCTSNKCTSCIYNYFVNPITNKCSVFDSFNTDSSLQSYYPDEDGTFKQCPINCQKCNQEQECQVCKDNFLLTDFGNKQNCVPIVTCPAKQYQQKVSNVVFGVGKQYYICQSCPEKCDACYEDVSGKPKCTQCSSGYILDSTGLECVVYCNNDEYKTLTSCIKYNPADTTLTCQEFYQDSDNCRKCVSGLYMKYNTVKNACVTSNNCGVGFYADPNTFICKKCKYNCSSCYWDSVKLEVCKICKTGYYLFTDPTTSNISCQRECPDGFYHNFTDGINRTCENCMVKFGLGCNYCTEQACSSCIEQYSKKYLLRDGRCVEQCNPSVKQYYHYLSTISSTNYGECELCQPQCSSCNDNLCCIGTNSESSCNVRRCDYNQYFDTTSNQCQACDAIDPDCLACDKILTKLQCFYCKNGKVYSQKNQQCQLKCEKGEYLLGNQCIQCPDPCTTDCFYDTILNDVTCLKCDSKKLQPKLSPNRSVCQQYCDKGYFANGDICLTCSPACASCTEYNTCTECNAGFILYAQMCIPSGYCPDKYYLDQNKCSNCHPTCKTCLGPLDSDCTSCDSDRSLQFQSGKYYCLNGTVQLDNCLAGYYSNNNVCNECSEPCSTCESQSFKCKSCKPGYKYDGKNYRCVLNCNEGMYYDKVLNECKINPIAECRKFKDNSSIQCLSCDPLSNKSLYTFNNGDTQCQINCSTPVGYTEIKDEYNNKFCIKCNSPCYECEINMPSKCITCSPLDSTDQWKNMYLLDTIKQCVYDCPEFYYKQPYDYNNGRYGKCVKCESKKNNCQQCYYNNTNSVEVCTQCKLGYILNATGDCVLYDPNSNTCMNLYTGVYERKNIDGYIVCPKCEMPCNTCDPNDPTKCSSCATGYYLQCDNSGNCDKCVQDCGEQFYKSADGTCAQCNPPCITCESETKCISCEELYFYYDYLESNVAVSKCKPCSENCEKCFGSEKYQCQICMPGFFKIKPADICVHTCPDGYYPNTSTRECNLCDDSCMTCKEPVPPATKVESCKTCRPKKNIDGSYTQAFLTSQNTCILFDPANSNGKYADLEKLQLLQCDPSCTKCESQTLCTECDIGYYLYQGKQCVQNCDNINGVVERYFNEINNNLRAVRVCTECEQLRDNNNLKMHCYNCLNGQCTSCLENYYLENGKCVLNCSTGSFGVYADNGWQTEALRKQRICKSCTSIPGCQLCTSDTICIKCQNDYVLQENGTQCIQKLCTNSSPRFYADVSQNICLPCPKRFKSCTLVSVTQPDVFETTECDVDYFLNPATKECQTECPLNNYSLYKQPNSLVGVCESQCSSTQYAYKKTNAGDTVHDNHCYDVCPDNEFSNIVQNKNECIPQSSCDITNDGTILVDEIGLKQCINANCSVGKFKDESGKCVTKCSGRLFGQESFVSNQRIGKCIKYCSNKDPISNQQDDPSDLNIIGFWGDINTKQCAQSCLTPTLYDANTQQAVNIQDRLCLMQCQNDKYQIPDKQLCVDKTVCTSNNLFYEESTKVCYENCPLLKSNISGTDNIQTYGLQLVFPSSDTDCNQNSLNALDKKCLSKCPCGYYGINQNQSYLCNKCKLQECIECNGIIIAGSSNGETQCKICKDTHYLYGYSCILTCPDTYYGVEQKIISDDPTTEYVENNTTVKKCIKCPSPCNKCQIKGSGTSESDEKECIDCELGYYYNPTTKNCVKTCQDGFYANKLTNTCTQCMANCLICESANVCLKCDNQNYLYMQKCQPDCNNIQRTFKDDILRRCSPCQDGCLKCTGGSKYQCQQCEYNAFLLKDSQCVYICPEPYFGWKSTMTCLEKAPEAYYLGDPVERIWTAICPKGYFEDPDSNICQTSCRKGYFEHSSLTLRTCNKCHELCETCVGPSLKDCITCVIGAYKRNGQCDTRCDKGKFKNPVTRECTDYLEYNLVKKTSPNSNEDVFEVKFNQDVNQEQIINNLNLNITGLRLNEDFTYNITPRGDLRTFDVAVQYKISHGNTQANFNLADVKSSLYTPLASNFIATQSIEAKYIPDSISTDSNNQQSSIQEIFFYILSSIFVATALISHMFKGDLTIFWSGVLRFQIVFFLLYLKFYYTTDTQKLISLFGLFNLTFLIKSDRDNIFSLGVDSQNFSEQSVFSKDSLTSSFLNNAFLYLLFHFITVLIWLTLRSQFYNIRSNRSDKSILQKRRFSLFFQSNFLIFRANELLYFPLFFFIILQFQKVDFSTNYNVMSFVLALAELIYFFIFLTNSFKNVVIVEKDKNEQQYQEMTIMYYGLIAQFKRYPFVKRAFQFVIYGFKTFFIIFLVTLSNYGSYQFICMATSFLVFSIYSIILRPYEQKAINYINLVADLIIVVSLALIFASDLVYVSKQTSQVVQDQDRIESINKTTQGMLWILFLWYVTIFFYEQLREFRSYCKQNPFWLVEIKEKLQRWFLCRKKQLEDEDDDQDLKNNKGLYETAFETKRKDQQFEEIINDVQWTENPTHKFHQSVIQSYRIGKKKQ